ncbi:hypothetical protein TrVE_jg3895 [Triparma verrucosa]|uniref:Spermidine synthase n=1 Tax=Triparma verrucosa TaxID=1606542 RepID=A0A9W7BXW9_9STRA|nr:hypothetical protein TrVE_jg3895 [Triparma verrucosa]
MSISGGTNNVELLKTPSLLITECDHTSPSTRVRRLYFTSNSNVIQSESYLHNSSFDYTKLSFGYHYIMSSSIYLTSEISTGNKSVVVGLGGGQFSMYLSKVMKVNITSIEISSEMKNIAAEYFGFEEDENNKVRIGDGIEAVGEFKGLDNVFIDVDTKDDSVGMSCPPSAFVETSYLSEVHSSLNPSGKIIINVSARDKSCLQTLLKNVNQIFNTVYISDSMPEEVNVVVIGFKEAPEVPDKNVLMERVEGDDMKEAICMWRKWKKKTRGGKKKK